MDKTKLHRALTRVLAARIPRDCASDLELLRDYIEDSEPVKHGQWIDNGIVYTCSECNSSVPKNIFVVGCDFEGCPYCFARMDGDKE